MKILVTGNAGFIGFHVARALLERGDAVAGLDNVNDYYDPALKEARLRVLDETARRTGAPYAFTRGDLADTETVDTVLAGQGFDRVIHLAGQAGVRHSLENPRAYVDSNITGFTNILEACRHNAIPHLTYASTSSVYGANAKLPFSTHEGVDHPLQFYAATKRANELMAHAYSHLFGLPTTGLRFFTVYGPWGRPDMALFRFTRNMLAGEPIPLFNSGRHARDFTYIDDVVDGILRASDRIAEPDGGWNAENPDPAASMAPFRLFNLGNCREVELLDYVAALEAALGITAKKEMLPPQPGDIPSSLADCSDAEKALGYKPRISVEEGVGRFVAWYRDFHDV